MKSLALIICISLNLSIGQEAKLIDYSYFEETKIEDTIRNTFIYQLKNNESFILKYHTQGCFHSAGYQLVFSKQKDKYSVAYKEEKKELNIEQVEHIRKFEKKLNRVSKHGGCTTTDYYELIYKGEIFKVEDSTCSWNGFNDLIEVLNIKLKE